VIFGALGMAISCAISAVVTYMMGFTKDELAEINNEKPGEMVIG
jgi:hypothetical protein